ncbi:serine/threonine-protein kinase [Streptomyces sp. HUAS MG91]|uniref:Serine/threonine-protein kinase n=1 Tax=Streptomyces tabacisoli TaxID=3156398 RepID=A0AAU8IY30_9ACTN
MPTALTHDDPAHLGPYRLVARLGSGGMGTVYMARSAGGRTLAVKTMHAAIAADPAARTRFRLETDAARVIGGRFGAKVADADPSAPTPWLATEYVLGPPLDEAVEATGPLPEQAVRVLGAALCGALAQLHRSDVVHRDLKPSNILVTAYGPKVIDFGIARAIGDIHLTHTGSAVGTPAFMSPEQATGQEHTAAGDVFALAGVLVHAARGSGPFGNGQPADLLYRVRYGEPDFTHVPAALIPVLARCLHKDPAQRPSTGQLAAQLHDGRGEFAEHLPPALLGEIGRRAVAVWQPPPPRAAPPQVPAGTTPVTAAPRRPGPSRRALLLGGGAVVAAAAAGGGLWWSRRSPAAGEDGAKGADGPEQTRNIDPLWTNEQINFRIDDWGLPVPYAVEGVIHLPFMATIMRFDPRTGSRTEDIQADGSPWGTEVVGGTEYLLGTRWNTGKTHPPACVSTWDEKQNYVKPTEAVADGTNAALDGNQLLCISGMVAYVAVGTGKDSYNGFLASQRFTLRALDIRAGRQLWSKPLPVRPDKSQRLHFLSAKVVGDRLVALQETGPGTVRVVVRDIRTGDVVWDKPYGTVEKTEVLQCPLAIGDGRIYLGGDRVRALRLSDGGQDWATGKGHTYSAPVFTSGVVHTVGEGVGLAALAADNGEKKWTEETSEVNEASTAWAPVLTERYGYYRNGNLLCAIDLKTHRVARTYKTAAGRFYVDTPDRLLLGMGEKTLSAYPLK